MKRTFLITALMVFFTAFMAVEAVPAADATPVIQPLVIQPLSVQSAARRAADQVSNSASYRQWKISLAPVVASQSLDVGSSYGMRELNPILAGPDGRFGARATGIKLGATAGLLGIEYLIVRRFPRSARVFSKINWSASIVTTGFAAHNFSIR
jgi:hypothetical protein